MTVLVTGGAGFIGSHLVDLLLKKGYSVRVLDSLEPPVHPTRQKPYYISSDVDFICGDVCRKSDLEKALKGVDYVFHLAAYQGYLPDFGKFARVNGGSTALLYEIIVNNHLPVKKVVVASSQAVYGEGKYECPEHGAQYPPSRSLEQLEKRAELFKQQLEKYGINSEIISSKARAGGGALPGKELESIAVKLVAPSTGEKWADKIFYDLLKLDVPVIGFIRKGELMFDVYTLSDDQVEYVAKQLSSLVK